MINRRRLDESYNDKIARLYPEESSGRLELGGKFCRSITFQTNENCNLCCFVAGTKILMSDFSYKNIEDIKVGDELLAFPENKAKKHSQFKLQKTKVTHTFFRHAFTREIISEDGGKVLTTDEHPFFNGRGSWVRAEKLVSKVSRCYDFSGNIPEFTEDYKIGYLVSVWLGDGTLRWFKNGVLRETPLNTNDRLAVKDEEILLRVEEYLKIFDVYPSKINFQISKKHNTFIQALVLSRADSEKLKDLILTNLNKNNSVEYLRGFLAGIIDTEGNVQSVIRVVNSNDDIIKQVEYALSTLGYNYVFDRPRKTPNQIVKILRVLNQREGENIRFLKEISPAVVRKSSDYYSNKAYFKCTNVISNTPTGNYETVYNLETDSHTYIANNFLVHNCTYCYEGHKTNRVMTLEVAKKAIDILLSDSELCKNYCNISDDPAVILDFIGGEPTLQLDLIDQICDYFEEQAFLKKLHIAHRFMISMSTNGTLCSTEKFRNFKKKWGHRFSYGVTVDGNKKLHDSCRVFPDGSGSFDLAIASAKEALAENPQSSTKFTLAPENIDYLIDALKYDIDMGYQIIHINCVYEEGWTIEHAKTLYKNFKEVADYILENDKEDIIISIFDENACHPMSEEDNQNWCGGANGLMLAIDVEGNFYPCMRYMPISIGQDQEPYIIGDLEHGLCNTPEHEARLDACNNITRRSQSTDECFNCPIASGCGHCSAYNYQRTGTVNKRVTYICPTHKARALYNCYYWNKLYRKRGESKRYLLQIPDDWALEIISEEELKMLKDLAKEG